MFGSSNARVLVCQPEGLGFESPIFLGLELGLITWLVSVILACIPKRLELVPSNSLGQYFRAMVTLLHSKELGAAPEKGLFMQTSICRSDSGPLLA